MIKHVLIAVLLIIAAFPAMADDVFLKPNASQQATQQTAPSTPAPAGTPQTTGSAEQIAFAQAYFQNCMQQKTDILSPDSQEMLCGCSSAQLQAGKMSMQEIALMKDNTPQGQKARNKMLSEIYAPCIEYPAHDLIMNRCMSDPKIKAATGNASQVCGCMAGNVSRHLAANAQSIIREELAKNPNNMDPLGIFLNSAAYEQQSRQATIECVL